VAIIFFSLTTAALVLLDFSVLVEIESLLYCLHVILLAGTVIRLRWKGTLTPPLGGRADQFSGSVVVIVELI